jgi:hypothetical protein
MKKILLSLVALSILCVMPALAADTSTAPVASAPTASASSAPSLPADLFTPTPMERGYLGPCTITVVCTCSCGKTSVSCSGKTYCVGDQGVSCDQGPWIYCSTRCNVFCNG